MFIQGDGMSADFASPPPVAELLWDSGDSDGDLPPPDVTALDPSLFDVDDDAERASDNSVAMSPEARATAAPVPNQANPSFTANTSLTAPSLSSPLALPRTVSRPVLAASDAAAFPSNTDHLLRTGSIRSPASFVIHSKKQSLVLQGVIAAAAEVGQHLQPSAAAPSATPSTLVDASVADQSSNVAPQPSPSEPSPPKAATQPRKKKGARGSVFTAAATEIMLQNPDMFKKKESIAVAEEEHPVLSGRVDRIVSDAAPSAAWQADTELDWSPGSEFVKFAGISALPSLKIPEIPAITDEYMETLMHYKREFIDAVFSASSVRNRTSRMRIFTGRQFVEFCLSDSCGANLRLTERGSAVGIGKLMCLYDFIHEVEDEHDFEDTDDLK
jgi:hypothetical protein